MKVAIGSDHAGYSLKEQVRQQLKKINCECKDFGVYSEDRADYPDIAFSVSKAVGSGEFSYGILICGTGIGMSIAANKYKGIRAALCSEPYSARYAREHNGANILTMGARVIGPGLASNIVEQFLNTSFAGGRHSNRIKKIADLESIAQNINTV